MRWPRLSIRATLLVTIVVGMVVPAIGVVMLDSKLARQSQQPIVERNRSAMMVLATAVMTEPAWTLSEPALQAAMRRILEEPSVCAVEVLDLQPTAVSEPLRRDECHGVRALAMREAPVLHEGQTIARLRLAFDDSEIDRLLAERRGMTAWVVTAQVLFGVGVLAAVLSLRLLRPIGALKRQADRLAAHEPDPGPAWPRGDELGELGQHLNAVHAQLRGLIEQLESKNAQLERMAMYDHLTALPNRTLMSELFAHEAAAARRDARLLAMLFVDLDHFKSVNDTLGHAAGDELLIAVSQRLRDVLRESDVVCRLGGDEFLVMLPNVEGWEQACTTAERLMQSVGQPLVLPDTGQPTQIGASIGIAIYPGDGVDFDELVRAADVAMYRSKDLGRGRVSLYQAEMDTALGARLALGHELGGAIEQGQLRLFVQPLMDARDGRLIGAEAQVHWMHPQRGLIGPGDIMHAAEVHGSTALLGRWTLDAACRHLAAWQAHGHQDLALSVKVSAPQLQDPTFRDTVQQLMQTHAVPAGALMLALAESALLADGEGIARAMAGLHQMGVMLAIDGFGTGYASLAALKRVRPDRLKIDRDLVQDLPGNEQTAALVEVILAMAHALGIAVVADGVETAAQRDWLLSRGGWRQQGGLWAQPAPAAAFEAGLPA